MKPPGPYLRGNVLPTVVVVSVLLLTALLGLVMLWEQESLLYARNLRLAQAQDTFVAFWEDGSGNGPRE